MEGKFYDLHTYWEGRELVKDGKKDIDKLRLTGNLKERVYTIAKDIVHEINMNYDFIDNIQTENLKKAVYNSIKEITQRFSKSYDSINNTQELSEDLKNHVLAAINKIVQGTITANDGIYNLLMSSQEVRTLGSDSDRETDREGLSDLEKFFEK